MANEKDLNKLETSIRNKMHRIKMKTLTPKASKIGVEINLMKKFDETLFNELMSEYKTILSQK